MTEPAMPQEDPFAAYQRKHGGAQQPKPDPFAAYEAKHGTAQGGGRAGGGAPTAVEDTGQGAGIHGRYLSGALAEDTKQAKEADYKALEDSMVEEAQGENPGGAIQLKALLGGIAAFGKNIPFVENAQATLRSLNPFDRKPFRQSLAEIRAAERSNPASGANAFTGGTIAALATPGSAVKSGAKFGAASALGKADPDRSIGDLAGDVAMGTAVGGAMGKVGEMTGNAVRTAMAKPLGRNALDRAATIKDVSGTNYGAATTEAAANGSHPDLDAAFLKPDIKPFVDRVASTREFSGKSPGEIAMEAYKQMTRQQAGLAQRLKVNGYDAAVDLERNNITAAKEELRNAIAQVAPSFPKAVTTHAGMAGERASMQEGADAAKRVASGTSVAGKKLGSNSPEAFSESIPKMKPANAVAATEGVFGRAREQIKPSFNPLTGFGVGKGVIRQNRLSPFIEQLDNASGASDPNNPLNGASITQILRALGINATTP